MASSKRDETHNPLPDQAKKISSEVLLGLTRDTTVLYLHVKMAHWNLRDVNFIAVHELLDGVAEALLTIIDETAERARQLGFAVDSSPAFLAKTTLSDFPGGVVRSDVACGALSKDFGQVIEAFHEGVDRCDESGDAVTTDLLTQSSGVLELNLWKIESHLIS